MTGFNEDDHRRDSSGKFAEQHRSEPDGVGLTAGDRLEFAPDVPRDLQEFLAGTDLTGRVELHDEDYEPYNGEEYEGPALRYTSPGGRELILTGIGTEDSKVWYEDPYDDQNSFSIESDPTGPAQADAEAIRDALWQRGQAEALYRSDEGLGNGDKYELRDHDLEVDEHGHLTASLTFKHDGVDEWTTLQHDYATGRTETWHEGERVHGDEADRRLRGVLEGVQVEARDGDWDAAASNVFDSFAQEAVTDQDAPANVKAAYRDSNAG